MRPLLSPLEIDFDSSASILEEKCWYGHGKAPFSFSFDEMYIRKYFIEFYQIACQNIWDVERPHDIAGIFFRNFWHKFRQQLQNLMKKLAIF